MNYFTTNFHLNKRPKFYSKHKRSIIEGCVLPTENCLLPYPAANVVEISVRIA